MGGVDDDEIVMGVACGRLCAARGYGHSPLDGCASSCVPCAHRSLGPRPERDRILGRAECGDGSNRKRRLTGASSIIRS